MVNRVKWLRDCKIRPARLHGARPREDKGDFMESVSGVGTGEADRRGWNEEEGEDVDTDHRTVYRGEERAK